MNPTMSDDDVLLALRPLQDAPSPPMAVDPTTTLRRGRRHRTRRTVLGGAVGALAIIGIGYGSMELSSIGADLSPGGTHRESSINGITVTSATELTPLAPEDPGVRYLLDLPWVQGLDDTHPGEPGELVLGLVGPGLAAARDSSWENALQLRPRSGSLSDSPLLVVGWPSEDHRSWSTGGFHAADGGLYVVAVLPQEFEGAEVYYSVSYDAGDEGVISTFGLVPALGAEELEGQRIIALRLSADFDLALTALDLVFWDAQGNEVALPSWSPQVESP